MGSAYLSEADLHIGLQARSAIDPKLPLDLHGEAQEKNDFKSMSGLLLAQYFIYK